MIKEIIDTWLEEVRKDLIKNYDRLGLRASGKWAKTLEPESNIKDDNIKASMLGQQYTGALEEPGRKPSKNNQGGKLRIAIRQWIDDKRIRPKGGISKDSLAFLITRKIHEEGIKVPNKYNKGGLVSDVVTKEKIQELIDKLGLFYQAELRSSLIKTLQ